ncbi:hypothetical protein M9H77_02867 [Catharanthus roseus]|uniref:Uncharacterized protein n=1 Tax=Catharanthus roseus TaxID=4058 RepID=A0ACC0C9S9_CATRO|nr:hypothetical protein M9H77_02867 [Catharanthus roseus]
MAGTLVHVSISKCEDASSQSASTNVFLKTYILLFGGRRASRGWMWWAGIHCLKPNCLITRSGIRAMLKSNNHEHLESYTASTEPHQLSSYPSSSEYPAVYSHSYNRSAETSICRACILRENV